MSSINQNYAGVCIAGCGDIGQRVAQLWLARSVPVMGLVVSEDSLSRLSAHHIPAQLSDFNDPTVDLPTLSKASLIYYFTPPPPSGMVDTRVTHFLKALSRQADKVARIVAISTTGVYGDCAGERVQETRPPAPQAERARRRLDMETQLRNWCDEHQVALIILRVGGIYGPGRLPLQRIKEGVPVLHPELAPSTNRIHADDLADICVAAAHVAHAFRIYNISDGSDSNMTEYFFTLADYFHLPRPPAVGWQEAEQSISKGMLSYLRESRRVDNTRMLKELMPKLRYPNLLAGLASCRADESETD